jgi:hypothetical protein
MTVTRFVTAFALSSAALTAPLSGAPAFATQPIDPVIQWNQNLLAIVRTPGAQPATIHPTRSFAILHAAIYDAVNAIDQTHEPYAITVSNVSRGASQPAAADAAAHDVLVAPSPGFTSTLDPEFQPLLALPSQTSTSPAPALETTLPLLSLSKASNICPSDRDANTALMWLWPDTGDRLPRPGRLVSGGGIHLSVGGVPIVGGLVPSANVAAQAGALDLSTEAMVTTWGYLSGGDGRRPVSVEAARSPLEFCR